MNGKKEKLERLLRCKIECNDNFHINFKENDSRIAEAIDRFDWLIDEIFEKDCCEIIKRKNQSEILKTKFWKRSGLQKIIH
jgi:hypothetical protein